MLRRFFGLGNLRQKGTGFFHYRRTETFCRGGPGHAARSAGEIF